MSKLHFNFPTQPMRQHWTGVVIPPSHYGVVGLKSIEDLPEIYYWLKGNAKAAYELERTSCYHLDEGGVTFSNYIYRLIFRSKRDAVLFKLSLL
jgi:hypothetical protein